MITFKHFKDFDCWFNDILLLFNAGTYPKVSDVAHGPWFFFSL